MKVFEGLYYVTKCDQMTHADLFLFRFYFVFWSSQIWRRHLFLHGVPVFDHVFESGSQRCPAVHVRCSSRDRRFYVGLRGDAPTAAEAKRITVSFAGKSSHRSHDFCRFSRFGVIAGFSGDVSGDDENLIFDFILFLSHLWSNLILISFIVHLWRIYEVIFWLNFLLSCS